MFPLIKKTLLGITLFLITGIIVLFSIYDGFYILEKKPLTISVNQSPKNDTIVYVINLDRSKERFAKILPLIQNLNLPYERISAVDGKKLSKQEITHYVDMKPYKIEPLRVGEVGCYLSHAQAWKQFLESDYQNAIIFEDDVSFDPALLKDMIHKTKSYPDAWDICSFDLGDINKSIVGLPIKKIDRQQLNIYHMHFRSLWK